MDGLDFWRLCDDLTVNQAALLIVGIEPGSEEGDRTEEWAPHQQPTAFAAAKSALTSAINGGKLPATVRHSARTYGWAERLDDLAHAGGTGEMFASLGSDERVSVDRTFVYRVQPDWNLTTVRVDDLRLWLAARGVRPAFFFPGAATDLPGYLDKSHPRYAPKLAAGVQAWLAVEDPKGKSPKQALQKWLREHGAEFGLTDEEGRPNEQGIEEVSKVGNWQATGGSPKTPGA